jgi:hypothetical protein
MKGHSAALTNSGVMQTDRSMRSLDMCRREVIAGNHGFCTVQAPLRLLSGSVMLRTLATAAAGRCIARYPGPWIVRNGGNACEAPVSCFGRG